MREIYKTYSLKGKKQMKTTTFSVALLVAATLVFGSVLPAMSIQTNTTKLNVNTSEINAQISCGPAPKNLITLYPSDLKSSSAQQAPISEDCYTMYAAKSWTSNDELVRFDTCDISGTFEAFGDYIAGTPTSGGTFGCDGVWYLGEQSSGVLYGADIFTGDMWSIGGGGMQCNGLAYDPTTNRMYGIHGVASPGQDEFYEYDPDTGDQEFIGKIGGSIYYVIGMAFDADGTLWGWDVATDSLFTIDLETGEATVVADLSIDLNYGQDGDFHRESNVLYLTAVTSSIQVALFTVDLETGDCTLVENFPSQEQITSSCFENLCIPPEHDVQVKSIDFPNTGPAVPSMPMQLTVKNSGNNTETFNAQMEVIKCEAGPLIMEEYFDGPSFPPEGWETDDWKLSYTNVAGGVSPEARVYRYDYSDYYDNYIQTGPTDCTGLEKVNLKFKWASDLYSPQYTNAFVKFRRNSTSPWKDVSPWDNPLGSSQDPDAYEIGCYGFGEPMGEEFQMRFEYIGYYYYFWYFWLDDVTLEACGGCAEYAELIEYIELDAGQEMIVEFPGWPPSEWHNETSENTWEEYPIHAWVDLLYNEDENARNDNKWKLIDLWYPYMHDISLGSIVSPSDPGDERWLPGQTFPVEATMFNAGQYPECCIPIEINIGNPIILDTLLEESTWPNPPYNVPATGWTDEHKTVAYYYGWQRSTSSNSGGESYEALLPYYYARADLAFYSFAIDTSAYAGLQFEFLSYINHYSGSGLYTLQAGYSLDAKDWYAAWSEEPSSSGNYEVSVPIEGGHETMYIGFWVKGNPYYFNYWYIDNVRVVATGLIEEFTDNACQGPDIEPGEYVTFQFDDWTPDFLQYEETGEKDYIVQGLIFMEGDKNPGNDILQEQLTLRYWHDVGIKELTSPATAKFAENDLIWDNGDTDGFNGYSILGSPRRGLIDDFEITETVTFSEARVYMVAGPVSDWEVLFWTDDDGAPGEVFETSTDISMDYEYTGRTWFGYSEWEVLYEFEPIQLSAGYYWCEQWSGSGQPNSFLMVRLTVWGEEAWMNYDDLGFMPVSQYFGTPTDLNFRLYGQAGGAPGIDVFIQPGTEDIGVTLENLGTFPKMGLTCYEEIWDFIVDPENGTLLREDEIGGIDLPTPLGGTKDLTYPDFTFADEGIYGIFFSLPTDPDDVTRNNNAGYGIGVDDTTPVSNYTLNPAIPDGSSGWYVNDVEILLQAMDPTSEGVSSGVKEIRYTVNNGAEEIIPGSSGTFVLTQDGENIDVKYWAVDNVGNAESKKTIPPIDIDQTPPVVEMSYEQTSEDPPTVLVTVNATDAMSTMDRVEFYLNDVLQETVPGTGPVYQWSFIYHGDLVITVKGLAFDVAGNSDFLEIDEFVVVPRNVPNQHSSNNTPRGRPNPR